MVYYPLQHAALYIIYPVCCRSPALLGNVRPMLRVTVNALINAGGVIVRGVSPWTSSPHPKLIHCLWEGREMTKLGLSHIKSDALRTSCSPKYTKQLSPWPQGDPKPN